MVVNLLKINFGKLKQWLQRLTTYTGLSSFFMLFYVFITSNDWLPWFAWLLCIGGGIFVLMLLDILWVMPQQLEYNSKKNPEWRKHMNQMDRIERKLNHVLGIDDGKV